MTREERKAKRDMQAARDARIAAAHEEARRAVREGCPLCGRPVRRNLALTGWVVCEQRGATGFRKDDAAPPCEWQGFTC